MSLNTFKDLCVDVLKDLYDAEQQILQALPKMESACKSNELKSAFQQHEQTTRKQVQRLEQVFQRLGESPSGKTCKGMQCLIQEGQELIQKGGDPDVLDAGLIAAAQKVEHYEIAGYGTARTWAREMGDNETAQLLEQTLQEEEQTDRRLTQLAESRINLQAVQKAA